MLISFIAETKFLLIQNSIGQQTSVTLSVSVDLMCETGRTECYGSICILLSSCLVDLLASTSYTCTYTYMHIHIYHIPMQVHTHIYIYISHIHTYTCAHTYTHIICIYIHIYIYGYICECACVFNIYICRAIYIAIILFYFLRTYVTLVG